MSLFLDTSSASRGLASGSRTMRSPDDASKDAIKRVNEEFARTFQASSGERIVREPEVKPLDAGEVSKNKLNVSQS